MEPSPLRRLHIQTEKRQPKIQKRSESCHLFFLRGCSLQFSQAVEVRQALIYPSGTVLIDNILTACYTWVVSLVTGYLFPQTAPESGTSQKDDTWALAVIQKTLRIPNGTQPRQYARQQRDKAFGLSEKERPHHLPAGRPDRNQPRCYLKICVSVFLSKLGI